MKKYPEVNVMSVRLLTEKIIAEFKEYLILEERSEATVEKYIRDVKAFAVYAVTV